MRTIRVVIGTMPKILREILVGTLQDHADIELVGESTRMAELPSLVRNCQPDVVIASCEEAEVDDVGLRVSGCSRVTLLAITDEGRGGSLFELRPWRIDLGEPTPTALVAAIREATRKHKSHTRATI